MQLVMAGPCVPDSASPSVTAMFLKIVRGRADMGDYQRYLELWDQLAAGLTRRTGVSLPVSPVRSRISE